MDDGRRRMEEIYLEFLRYSLDDGSPLPASAQDIDWMRMLEWAERQAVVGVIYGGITDGRSLRDDGRGSALQIPFDALMEWVGYAQQIEAQNRLMNKRCVEIVEELRKGGFESCILKGQGNALMYPNPLLRMSGDIDVWVCGAKEGRREGVLKSGISEVIEYVRRRNPGGKAVYHHIDYGLFKGVEVEVHYRPTFMNNLIVNRRLQRWMQEKADGGWLMAELPDGAGEISVPTWEFNVVFQLSHIYRHVIQSGVGMRQMVDYYYLLKSDGRCMMEDVSNSLEYLGLMEIAGAVMWVLKEVLGLEERYLVAPVDERRGRFLLSEIMEGGNFGRGMMAEGGWQSSAIGRNVYRLKRDVRLLRYFSSECLWEPVFRVYHFFWRSGV